MIDRLLYRVGVGAGVFSMALALVSGTIGVWLLVDELLGGR